MPLLQMPPHMLHALVPALRPLKHALLRRADAAAIANPAVAAHARLRRLARLDPAAAARRLERGLEGFLLGGGGGPRGRVHAPQVLGEEVFAVEVVEGGVGGVGADDDDVVFFGAAGRRGGGAGAFLAGGGRRAVVGEVRDAGALVATPEAELDVLGGDVALPFVFGAEARGAAVGAEGAGEGAGVGGEVVFVHGGGGGEGLVAVGAGVRGGVAVGGDGGGVGGHWFQGGSRVDRGGFRAAFADLVGGCQLGGAFAAE